MPTLPGAGGIGAARNAPTSDPLQQPAPEPEGAPALAVAAVSPGSASSGPEAAWAPLPLFQQPVTVDGGASVEVLGNQSATVNGEATSLRAVVEEICRQAGVELRAYTAADRRYAGHLQNLPLQDVFRSLFRSESYLVGLTFDEESREKRITWLQVLGTTRGTGSGAAGQAAAPGTPPPPTLVRPSPRPEQKFVLSPTLLYEAFGTMDPARREQAQREALNRLSDPQQRIVFLNTDPSEIANVVANYEHSAEGVRLMKRMTDLPDVQSKLDEVLNILGEPDDATGRN